MSEKDAPEQRQVSAIAQVLSPSSLVSFIKGGQLQQVNSISWIASPPVGLREKEKALLKSFITGTFAKGASLIGLKKCDYPALMRTKTGFELTFSSLPCSNSIDPETLEGSGEIRMEHGHKPLLMLLYLQKRFREEFPKLRTELLAFATDDGRPFQYRRFDDLKPLVIELGLDTEAVRKDAEQLGLASKVIQFSEIETEVQDHYF